MKLTALPKSIAFIFLLAFTISSCSLFSNEDSSELVGTDKQVNNGGENSSDPGKTDVLEKPAKGRDKLKVMIKSGYLTMRDAPESNVREGGCEIT